MSIKTQAEETYKIVLRNFTKRKENFTLLDKTREVGYTPLISKCNNGIRVILYVANIYS